MASFISATEQADIIATFSGSFDTWSRNIVVFKEPLRTEISPLPSENLYGFGESQQNPTYTYTPRSGIFPAIVRYSDIEKDIARNSLLSPEILARIYSGPVSIKVREDCRDYINNGITERFIIDEQTFLIDGDERLQTYQGSKYYIYQLRKTK